MRIASCRPRRARLARPCGRHRRSTPPRAAAAGDAGAGIGARERDRDRGVVPAAGIGRPVDCGSDDRRGRVDLVGDRRGAAVAVAGADGVVTVAGGSDGSAVRLERATVDADLDAGRRRRRGRDRRAGPVPATRRNRGVDRQRQVRARRRRRWLELARRAGEREALVAADADVAGGVDDLDDVAHGGRAARHGGGTFPAPVGAPQVERSAIRCRRRTAPAPGRCRTRRPRRRRTPPVTHR